MNLITQTNILGDIYSYNKNAEGIELTNATLHSDEGKRFKFKNQTPENSHDLFTVIASGNFKREVPLDDEIAMFIIQKIGANDKYEISADEFNSIFV